MTGIKPDKDQLPDERIGHDLEAQRCQRLAVVRMAEDDLFHVVGIVTLDRRHVQRARQIIDHRIQ